MMEGPADKSYGIHVAKIAGLPSALLQRAATILKALEEHEPTVQPKPVVEESQQLSLFSEVSTEEIGVIDQLKKLNLLEMTPMDALNTLYELQNEFRKKVSRWERSKSYPNVWRTKSRQEKSLSDRLLSSKLVENAVDAGSTQIDIFIEEAGLRKIQVIDNGEGIAEEDVLTAFKRHATSKIHNRDDLFRIRTLGFRGEALPSIASVSILSIETAVKGAQQGSFVRLKAALLKSICLPTCGKEPRSLWKTSFTIHRHV